MKFGEALSEAMRRNGQRDEAVAMMVGVSAQQVMKWRTGRAEPRRAVYDDLRRKIAGFADLIDGAAAVA